MVVTTYKVKMEMNKQVMFIDRMLKIMGNLFQIASISFGDLKMAAATLILKIKEKHKISQYAIKGIIEDVIVLFQTCLLHLFKTVKEHLEYKGIDEETISCISPLFDGDGDYGKPFKGLETEYLQLKFFKTNFALVVSSFSFKE